MTFRRKPSAPAEPPPPRDPQKAVMENTDLVAARLLRIDHRLDDIYYCIPRHFTARIMLGVCLGLWLFLLSVVVVSFLLSLLGMWSVINAGRAAIERERLRLEQERTQEVLPQTEPAEDGHVAPWPFPGLPDPTKQPPEEAPAQEEPPPP